MIQVARYLNDIQNNHHLTRGEEIELTKKIKQGCRKSLHKLVTSNLKFVLSVCKNYRNQGLPLEDLISEGNIGLMKAAESYDWTTGNKFISYAVWWIRAKITYALSQKSRLIRPPNNAKLTLKQPISMETLISKTGQKIEDIIMDEKTQKPDKILDDKSNKEEVEELLHYLTPKQKMVIVNRYGIGCAPRSLQDISEKMGFTKEGVRQIEEKAISRMIYWAKLKKFIKEGKK